MSMDTDLADIMVACTEGKLNGIQLHTKPRSSVTVVAAAGVYPESYKKGDTLSIYQSHTLTENDHVFHAGTALNDGSLKSAGDCLIAATSIAESLQAALTRAYNIMGTINWPGKHCRNRIAHRAIKVPTQSEPLIPESGMTNAGARVSISAGNELVECIKALVKSTARPGASGALGGFGGVFDPAAAVYKEVPLLVTGTDGVGTRS